MDPALVGRPAGKIGMIGTARDASVGEDQDGFHAVHERLGLGEIGACAASFELLGNVAADHTAARPASRQTGRAHVWTPVTNTHLVCRPLLTKQKHYHTPSTQDLL